MKKEIENFCSEIGLNKSLTNRVSSVVRTDEDLEKLKCFIIDNDGKFRTNLELIHSFATSLGVETNYKKDDFIKDYQNGKKKEAMNIMSQSSFGEVLLHKVEELLLIGLTLEYIYDSIICEKSLNANQVLNLLKKKVDILV